MLSHSTGVKFLTREYCLFSVQCRVFTLFSRFYENTGIGFSQPRFFPSYFPFFQKNSASSLRESRRGQGIYKENWIAIISIGRDSGHGLEVSPTSSSPYCILPTYTSYFMAFNKYRPCGGDCILCQRRNPSKRAQRSNGAAQRVEAV